MLFLFCIRSQIIHSLHSFSHAWRINYFPILYIIHFLSSMFISICIFDLVTYSLQSEHYHELPGSVQPMTISKWWVQKQHDSIFHVFYSYCVVFFFFSIIWRRCASYWLYKRLGKFFSVWKGHLYKLLKEKELVFLRS